jgi:hypothetical protein
LFPREIFVSDIPVCSLEHAKRATQVPQRPVSLSLGSHRNITTQHSRLTNPYRPVMVFVITDARQADPSSTLGSHLDKMAGCPGTYRKAKS